eukprot:CAMPEP_0202896246 /NCGR_PEP_ID=MMETSP1392-20130828/5275_1 /ASSEMBLY_ACC=CAM_ASM_000868 /TAXON_ID=225041 /ORGANISM="Chlamydomonas chlamydogama, Strain SAG 11-48b" /LENGTH=105 /DNA_ID=CAMNT_0049581517 /DNA_START=71 /DNA_END=388 /DNA_ORIENTATION=-
MDEKLLVLDNNSPHRAAMAKQFCKAEGIKLVYLPPYSPDLSPLDCNLFGVVKGQYDRLFPGATKDWNERSKLFVQLLKNAQAVPHVSGWRAKLEAVVIAGGHKVH